MSDISKKIVAMGGGENGRVKADGTVYPYELEKQDREIIRLTGKEHPNFLFIGHSQLLENQEGYFQVMKAVYEQRYGCSCKDLKSNKLNDVEYVKTLIDWADIIYEGGGNTLDMIKMWKETGFDKILRQAWESGKVMCGVSAGANCWFKECSSDSLKIKYGDDQPLSQPEPPEGYGTLPCRYSRRARSLSACAQERVRRHPPQGDGTAWRRTE